MVIHQLFNSKKDMSDRIYLTILSLVKFTLVIAILGAVWEGAWEVLFVSALTLILIYVPDFFEKKSKINLPLEFELIIVIFIYATLFLGTAQGLYVTFWWWDSVIHAGTAVGLGFVGFLILYILYKGGKIKASPGWIALFSFFFAVGIGAVWEIFEFGMDEIFGTMMQESGLPDTMGDLIVDSLGALLASVIGYFYIKGNENFIFKRWISQFAKENPELFRRREEKRIKRRLRKVTKKKKKLEKKIGKIKLRRRRRLS